MILCIHKIRNYFLVLTLLVLMGIFYIIEVRIFHIKSMMQVLRSRKRNVVEGWQFTTKFPVDLVYTWVNGSDPKHQENLVHMMSELKKSNSLTASNKKNLEYNRFADYGGLRYSLRSLEKFANWIRHVFIVTNGQIPYWLDLKNPRVTLVRHEELFSDLEYLPTFSSPAIEHNLYKIKGLSNKFIYMNDDIMFGRNITLDDFYTEGNGTKIYNKAKTATQCSDQCTIDMLKNDVCDQVCNYDHCAWDGGDCRDVPEYNRPLDDNDTHCDYTTSLFYTNAIFNRFFGNSTRNAIAHVPLFIDKHLNIDMVNMFRNEVNETIRHRVRNPLDLQFGFSYMHFLIATQNRYEALYESKDVAFVMLTAEGNKSIKAQHMLLRGEWKFICLNDDIDYNKVIEASLTIALMQDFLKLMFPIPSSFEDVS